MENQEEQKENLNEQLKGSEADYAYPNLAANSDLTEELKGSDADYVASGDDTNSADEAGLS